MPPRQNGEKKLCNLKIKLASSREGNSLKSFAVDKRCSLFIQSNVGKEKCSLKTLTEVWHTNYWQSYNGNFLFFQNHIL